MIESIRFANYRAFKDEGSLVLRPVTLLIGRNSSGKSSLCRLIHFLSFVNNHEVWASDESTIICPSRNYSDLFFKRTRFGLVIGADYGSDVGFTTNYYLDDHDEMKVSSRSVRNGDKERINADAGELRNGSSSVIDGVLLNEVGLSNATFQFDETHINSIRTMAKEVYRQADAREVVTVADDGATAYSLLLNSYLKRTSLIEDVAQWMEQNLDGQRLSIKDSLDSYEFRIERAGNSVRIQDVGQGISQILPIIVQTFIQRPNSVTIVEEPELHLHPSAHAVVMERIANSAMQSRSKYVVETHSENMLLAVRRMVSRGQLQPEDVSISYVDMDEGQAVVRQIVVDNEGMLDWWPSGVFSESYDLLNDILV